MKVLILAGTREARELSMALENRGHQVVVSLAGATEKPLKFAGALRVGGFGGADEQAGYMAKEGFDAVVDATHPFAAKITQRTHQICADLPLPLVRLARETWRATSEDDWVEVANARDLGAVVPKEARVFLATGPKALAEYQSLHECQVFCRRIDAPTTPFPMQGAWIVGRPPFTVEAEIALFERLNIEWLVVKNSGGPTDAKLEAARRLGLRVAMISRPPVPLGACVNTVDEAVTWLEAVDG